MTNEKPLPTHITLPVREGMLCMMLVDILYSIIQETGDEGFAQLFDSRPGSFVKFHNVCKMFGKSEEFTQAMREATLLANQFCVQLYPHSEHIINPPSV